MPEYSCAVADAARACSGPPLKEFNGLYRVLPSPARLGPRQNASRTTERAARARVRALVPRPRPQRQVKFSATQLAGSSAPPAGPV